MTTETNKDASTRRTGLLWAFALVIPIAGLSLHQGRVGAKAAQSGPPAAADAPVPSASVAAGSPVDAGRYIVRVGGCNDCHTPAFAMRNGDVPEAQWLIGDVVGYRGPWGTSYASNLRLFVKDLSADDFVRVVRARTSRPPMPWPSMHAMSDKDLRAVHAYLKALGPTGKPAPEYVPPMEEPKTPYINFAPVLPKGVPVPTGQG